MCVCVSMDVCVCVCIIFEIISTVNHKPKHCVSSRVCFAASNGENMILPPPKQYLTESSFFEISTSNSEHNWFRFMALIF